MFHVNVTNQIVTNPAIPWHAKTYRLDVMECRDLDGSSYWIVFDPRSTEMIDGKHIREQIRCDTLDIAMRAYREIAMEALDEYIEYLRNGGYNGA